MADDLTRALERRTLRTRQVAIATAAAVLAVAARHASRDLEVTAVAAVAAVAISARARAGSGGDPRARRIVARASSPVHGRSAGLRPLRPAQLECCPDGLRSRAAAARDRARALRSHKLTRRPLSAAFSTA